jgi:hypothetical protein
MAKWHHQWRGNIGGAISGEMRRRISGWRRDRCHRRSRRNHRSVQWRGGIGSEIKYRKYRNGVKMAAYVAWRRRNSCGGNGVALAAAHVAINQHASLAIMAAVWRNAAKKMKLTAISANEML